MSFTVLAILDRPTTAPAVLAAAALAAARIGGSRIEALHLRHAALEGFMPTEDVMPERRRQEIDAAAARQSADVRAIFDAWRRDAATGDWREVIGATAKVVAAAAGSADLVVIGHGAERYQGDARQAVHVSLFDAKRATLLVPQTAPVSLGRRVAVAWKPGQTADRAVDAALPLLLQAEQVTVLVETGDGGREPEPGTLLQRLRQGRVAVTMRRFQANDRQIGAALIEEAHAVDADLLVMGAYSHSRLAEFILGGATREVLAAADLPVLMHH